jgi:molybdopterin converting factor small subunit
MMKIRVVFFAVLKDFFGSELEMTCKNLEDLKKQLINLSPYARSVIEISKFASGNQMIVKEYTFTSQEVIYVLPPSSGG